MNNLGAYSITMIMLLGFLIGVALLLARYRDRLHARFGTPARVFRASVEGAPGARLMVVDIDGLTVVCGLSKEGITALHVVQGEQTGGAS